MPSCTIEDRATAPTDTQDAEAILASVPRKAINKGRRRFCTIGGGNHFLELQEIVDVLDQETADQTRSQGGQSRLYAAYLQPWGGEQCHASLCAGLAEKFLPQHSATPASPLWSVPADTENVQFARAIAAAILVLPIASS